MTERVCAPLTEKAGASPHVGCAGEAYGRHIAVLGDDGGGDGEADAERDDREGDEHVERAVHLDKHGEVPFVWFGPRVPVALSDVDDV